MILPSACPAFPLSRRRLTGPGAAAAVVDFCGTRLSTPRGITGTMTIKIISSTSSTSISGVTLISDRCPEFDAENAMATPRNRNEEHGEHSSVCVLRKSTAQRGSHSASLLQASVTNLDTRAAAHVPGNSAGSILDLRMAARNFDCAIVQPEQIQRCWRTVGHIACPPVVSRRSPAIFAARIADGNARTKNSDGPKTIAV